MYDRALLLLTRFQISGRRLLDSNSGATAVEYGLILACIAVLTIGAMQTLGTALSDFFQARADWFDAFTGGN